MDNDPGQELRVRRYSPQRTLPAEPPEVRRLLQYLENSSDPLAGRDLAIFATLAYCGMRRADVLALRIGDVHTADGFMTWVSTKSGRRQQQQSDDNHARILRRYLGNHPFRDDPRAPLFPGRSPALSGRPRSVLHRFHKCIVAAGVRRPLTLHSLRAGLAMGLYRCSGDLLLVAAQLGHRDLRSLHRYLQPDRRRLDLALKRTTSTYSQDKKVINSLDYQRMRKGR